MAEMNIILQVLLIALLCFALGYVCYSRGLANGIRMGRIDEQRFNMRRAVMEKRARTNWHGYN